MDDAIEDKTPTGLLLFCRATFVVGHLGDSEADGDRLSKSAKSVSNSWERFLLGAKKLPVKKLPVKNAPVAPQLDAIKVSQFGSQ